MTISLALIGIDLLINAGTYLISATTSTSLVKTDVQPTTGLATITTTVNSSEVGRRSSALIGDAIVLVCKEDCLSIVDPALVAGQRVVIDTIELALGDSLLEVGPALVPWGSAGIANGIDGVVGAIGVGTDEEALVIEDHGDESDGDDVDLIHAGVDDTAVELLAALGGGAGAALARGGQEGRGRVHGLHTEVLDIGEVEVVSRAYGVGEVAVVREAIVVTTFSLEVALGAAALYG